METQIDTMEKDTFERIWLEVENFVQHSKEVNDPRFDELSMSLEDDDCSWEYDD